MGDIQHTLYANDLENLIALLPSETGEQAISLSVCSVELLLSEWFMAFKKDPSMSRVEMLSPLLRQLSASARLSGNQDISFIHESLLAEVMGCGNPSLLGILSAYSQGFSQWLATEAAAALGRLFSAAFIAYHTPDPYPLAEMTQGLLAFASSSKPWSSASQEASELRSKVLPHAVHRFTDWLAQKHSQPGIEDAVSLLCSTVVPVVLDGAKHPPRAMYLVAPFLQDRLAVAAQLPASQACRLIEAIIREVSDVDELERSLLRARERGYAIMPEHLLLAIWTEGAFTELLSSHPLNEQTLSRLLDLRQEVSAPLSRPPARNDAALAKQRLRLALPLPEPSGPRRRM